MIVIIYMLVLFFGVVRVLYLYVIKKIVVVLNFLLVIVFSVYIFVGVKIVIYSLVVMFLKMNLNVRM